jgi:DNA uptake protein ComE-like DNA-binding protein
VSVIPPETRLNLNAASAEQLVSLKGIGYATAKKIIELRNSMTGERFKNLDQLRGIERVDWDEVLKEDQFYIG